MDKTTIKFKRVKLRNPILLVGLPGIGNVGSLVAEHLKNELYAKRFATIYSPHFPNQVFMLKNGKIRMATNRFYYWRNPSKKSSARDLILLLGDFQAPSPEGSYEVNHKIVNFYKYLGGKEIYTIGGYSGGSNKYVPNPKVLGVANSDKALATLKKHKVIIGKASGAIWGSAGLIIAFAKKKGIDGACIMGETGMLEVDANSAKAVLETLNSLLELNVDLEGIDKIRKETEKMIKQIEETARSMGDTSKENMTYIR